MLLFVVHDYQDNRVNHFIVESCRTAAAFSLHQRASAVGESLLKGLLALCFPFLCSSETSYSSLLILDAGQQYVISSDGSRL